VVPGLKERENCKCSLLDTGYTTFVEKLTNIFFSHGMIVFAVDLIMVSVDSENFIQPKFL
jgi:hypothetical protein